MTVAKKRLTRSEELAQRFAELQIAAVKYTGARDNEWRSQELARAAERYVAVVEATMKIGAVM